MYIGKFWIVIDNIDCFVGILWRIVVNGDEIVYVILGKDFKFFLDNGNCRIRDYVSINFLC